jgi:hypothetical protein
MNDLLSALAIPHCARVDRRMPKTLLVEHGALSANDRRRVMDGIEEIRWVAALKPTTISVPELRDDTREYVEIQVLTLTIRRCAPISRITELLHRSIPYPVLALIEFADSRYLSMSNKRYSQANTTKMVLDGTPIEVEAPRGDEPFASKFLEELALDRQPRNSMFALYQGWVDTMIALLAARRTGRFVLLDSVENRQAREKSLRDCDTIDGVISRLRSAAAREKQVSRQVELNLEIKRVQARYAELITLL